MKKYTKEYCKQNKVAIIVNNEEYQKLIKFLDSRNPEKLLNFGYAVLFNTNHYDLRIWSSNWIDLKYHEIITFQQFIQDNEEFVLPEKWGIKAKNNDENEIIKKYANTLEPKNCWAGNSALNFYLSYDELTNIWRSPENLLKDYTEITYDQFCKYVLKKETNMKEKEIIGYKLIKPQYEEAACKIAGVVDLHIYPSGWSFQVNTSAKLKLEKAGVLDIWFEKIYAPEKPVEVMVDMGSFQLKVTKDGIFHKTEDITNFVQNLHDVYTKLPSKFGSYDCIVDEITFKKTGCESNKTSLKQWITAYTEYLKLKN